MLEPNQYRLRAAIPFENQVPPHVFWTAINLYDGSISEVPIDLEHSRNLFRFVYGEQGDSQMELLLAQGELDLVKQRNGETHCIINSHELLRFGFAASELHPWKIEDAA